MKRNLKILLKILGWTTAVFVVILSVLYFWVKSSWTDVYTDEQMEELTSEINVSQPLPENFTSTLTRVYPDIFEYGFTGHVISRLFTGNDHQPCPCRQVSNTLHTNPTKAKRPVGVFYPVSLTWAIEERVSQEECLAYYLNNFDFLKGIIGIENASQLYFNSELENLTISQQLELILIIKNPSFYDREKRPEAFEVALRRLKFRIADININKEMESSSISSKDGALSSNQEYSKEFLKQFEESEMTLKNDSILLPVEAGSAVVLIPQYIPKNKEITFVSEDGQTISIRQLNYTDIEFLIDHKGGRFSGKASLHPQFHLGMETVEFSDGEYVITHYYVTETDNPCLRFIGLGNQNIIEDTSEEVYALVSVSGGTCENELQGLTNKKLKTVSNKTMKK